MQTSLEKAILKTISYTDIFDFPLKKEEIWQRLIFEKKKEKALLSKKNFAFSLKALFERRQIGAGKGFYFLPGREETVQKRQERAKWSREKLKKAKKAGQSLQAIPTVRMVGVTGNLAVENCQKDDDIDLLIVASPGALWLTRILATLLFSALGQRRHPGQKDVCDKICLNMFMDEKSLEIPKVEQDLYTAHEVAQLKLLWERGNTYQKFLNANLWAKTYLQNAFKNSAKTKDQKPKTKSQKKALLLNPLEVMAKNLQLWYMRKKRTTEVITEGMIRFHPKDARPWILKEYEHRLQKYFNFRN